MSIGFHLCVHVLTVSGEVEVHFVYVFFFWGGEGLVGGTAKHIL